LPALEHHTYRKDDVEEGGIKTKKKIFFHENGNGKKVKKIKFYFYSKSPLLDVGGFAKQGIKKYSPKVTPFCWCTFSMDDGHGNQQTHCLTFFQNSIVMRDKYVPAATLG
jgi:hypothetical protein